MAKEGRKRESERDVFFYFLLLFSLFFLSLICGRKPCPDNGVDQCEVGKRNIKDVFIVVMEIGKNGWCDEKQV